MGALGDGFANRKRCSEPGAGPYCIKDATGLGMAAEYGGMAMTFLGGAAMSINAIETPGAYRYVTHYTWPRPACLAWSHCSLLTPNSRPSAHLRPTSPQAATTTVSGSRFG